MHSAFNLFVFPNSMFTTLLLFFIYMKGLFSNRSFTIHTKIAVHNAVVVVVVVVVVDPTPPTCCQQSPAPESCGSQQSLPPRWQGKAPLCRDSSRGPG